MSAGCEYCRVLQFFVLRMMSSQDRHLKIAPPDFLNITRIFFAVAFAFAESHVLSDHFDKQSISIGFYAKVEQKN